jgi:hypothetical protein
LVVSAKTEEPQLLSKDLVVFIPLIGTVIAISYDVGYFYGIDVKLFTLFSVSEHIVFALEATPFALAAAIVVAAFVGTGVDRTVGLAVYVAGQKIQKRKTKLYIDVTLIAAVIILIGAVIYFRKLWVAASLVSGMSVALLRILPLANRTIYLVAGALVIICAFGMGHDFARSYVLHGPTTHSIQLENETLSVKLIRSGDRGLLYYEPKSKQLSFLRWEAVKRLTSSDLE